MEIISLIVGATITLLSVYLSSFLIHRIDEKKSEYETQKQLNLVLFNLLEAFTLTCKLNAQINSNSLNDKILQAFHDDDNKISIKEKTDLNHYLLNMLQASFNEQIKKLNNSYTEAVKILSNIEPFLAYHLSSKVDSLESVANLDRIVIKNMPNGFNLNSFQDQKVLALIQSKITEGDIPNFEDSILQVAKLITKSTHENTLKKLKSIKEVSAKSFNEDFDKFIKDLVNDTKKLMATFEETALNEKENKHSKNYQKVQPTKPNLSKIDISEIQETIDSKKDTN